MQLDNEVLSMLRDYPEAITTLAMAHNDINEITYFGHSLLYTAVSAGLVEATVTLCSLGAAWRQDDGEDQLLTKALKEDNGAIIKSLSTAGMDFSPRGVEDENLLHYAAEYGKVSVARALINLGLDVNAKNTFQTTALHKAAEKGHLGVVKVLLAGGAEKDRVDSIGRTPLHLAARYGHAAIAATLLHQGACVNARDKLKRSPLDMAIQGLKFAKQELQYYKGGAT